MLWLMPRWPYSYASFITQLRCLHGQGLDHSGANHLEEQMQQVRSNR